MFLSFDNLGNFEKYFPYNNYYNIIENARMNKLKCKSMIL